MAAHLMKAVFWPLGQHDATLGWTEPRLGFVLLGCGEAPHAGTVGYGRRE